MLFGESYIINTKQEKWWHIQLTYDGYEGWIDAKQGYSISDKDFKKLIGSDSALSFDICCQTILGNSQVPLTMGATFHGFDGMHFKFGRKKGFFNGQVVRPGQNGLTIELVEKIALRYLNTPYLWGGRSSFGIDCSGFTQMVFKFLNIKLKRDAYQQAEQGNAVTWLTEARKGDLAFFANDEGRINHVGIILDEERIIHASGKVRIDKLDNYGIYHEESRNYSHKLKLIKRLTH